MAESVHSRPAGVLRYDYPMTRLAYDLEIH